GWREIAVSPTRCPRPAVSPTRAADRSQVPRARTSEIAVSDSATIASFNPCPELPDLVRVRELAEHAIDVVAVAQGAVGEGCELHRPRAQRATRAARIDRLWLGHLGPELGRDRIDPATDLGRSGLQLSLNLGFDRFTDLAHDRRSLRGRASGRHG